MRAATLLALLVVAAALAAGCGPTGPVEAGGEEADPVPLLTVLPSPDDLRGGPAVEAGPADLLEALLGSADPVLADRLGDRGLGAAGVRRWSRSGGELTAAVSVWRSHLVATGIGADAAARLVQDGDGRAWTPSQVGGGRGAQRDAGADSDRRLAFSVGPNALYVRATGDVPAEIVVRTMRRLIEAQQGRENG